MNVGHSILLIAITAIITFATRALPFVIFSGDKGMPPLIRDIADKLPPAIIAVLVIYCLKNAIVTINMETLASVVAIIGVVLLHLWKRNTLLSVAAGTAIYMICLRLL